MVAFPFPLRVTEKLGGLVNEVKRVGAAGLRPDP